MEEDLQILEDGIHRDSGPLDLGTVAAVHNPISSHGWPTRLAIAESFPDEFLEDHPRYEL